MSWYGRVTGKAAKNWRDNKDKQKKAIKQGAVGRSGYVYIISLGSDNLYKIGQTTDIMRRMKELSAANNSLKCVYSAMVRDRFIVESELHKRYKKFKVEREIYSIPALNTLDTDAFIQDYR